MSVSCDEIAELAYRYADRELAPAERAHFEAHLDGCASCRRALQRELAFLASIRIRLAPGEAPRALRDGLSERLDRADHAPRRARFRLAAAALAAVAALAVWVSSLVAPGPARVDPIARLIDDPVEVSAYDPDELSRLIQHEVGVRAPPPRFGSLDAAPRRVWLTRLGGRPAVGLEYRLGPRAQSVASEPAARSVVVYAFRASGVSSIADRTVRVGGTTVRIRTARGLSEVVYTRRGVGFALIAAMSEDQLVDLLRHELTERM